MKEVTMKEVTMTLDARPSDASIRQRVFGDRQACLCSTVRGVTYC